MRHVESRSAQHFADQLASANPSKERELRSALVVLLSLLTFFTTLKAKTLPVMPVVQRPLLITRLLSPRSSTISRYWRTQVGDWRRRGTDLLIIACGLAVGFRGVRSCSDGGVLVGTGEASLICADSFEHSLSPKVNSLITDLIMKIQKAAVDHHMRKGVP